MSVLGDIINQIDGGAATNTQQQQVAAQAQQNQALIDLQSQALAAANSPAVIKQNEVKYILVFLGFVTVVVGVFLYFKYVR